MDWKLIVIFAEAAVLLFQWWELGKKQDEIARIKMKSTFWHDSLFCINPEDPVKAARKQLKKLNRLADSGCSSWVSSDILKYCDWLKKNGTEEESEPTYSEAAKS